MANSSQSPANRRRLPRFSLRTLLILMGILGVGLGCLGAFWRRVKTQRRIVAAVTEAGGEVKYQYEFGVGKDLDAELDIDSSVEPVYRYTEYGFNDAGYEERRRYAYRWIGLSGVREMREVEVETPPGPTFLRQAFGDDLFSSVEEVNFFWLFSADRPAHFDPQLLLQIPRLKVLSISQNQVSDEWLRWIGRAQQIRVVNLSGGDVGNATGAGLRSLQTAERLEVLNLSGTWVQDDSMKGLSQLRQLTALNLWEPDITQAFFANLRDLTELRELTIQHGYWLDDQGTESLAHLQELRRLWLTRTSMTDASLIHISQLKQLKCLDISWSWVGDPGMEMIGGLSNLMRLNVSHTCVSDRGVKHLARLRQLRSLSIGETSITDEALTMIAGMTQLEILNLYPGNISDEGLRQLQTLRNLKRLEVGPNISKAAVDELQNALPECEIMAFDYRGRSL